MKFKKKTQTNGERTTHQGAKAKHNRLKIFWCFQITCHGYLINFRKCRSNEQKRYWRSQAHQCKENISTYDVKRIVNFSHYIDIIFDELWLKHHIQYITKKRSIVNYKECNSLHGKKRKLCICKLRISFDRNGKNLYQKL